MNTPGIPTQLVVRRALLARLDERFRCALVTIEAGAGFGKTCVMRQAIAEAAVLDRATELVVTCRAERTDDNHGPAIVGQFARQLGCAASPEGIADAVLAASPRPVVLWIDDVHHFSGTSGLIDRLLSLLPANGHLGLVGRFLPVVSTARLDLQGQLLSLGEEDLRFDLDERAAFLHLRGVESDQESVSASSGWPAVMELELAVGRSGAADYLTEEVLVDLPPERLDALRRLSDLHVIDEQMVRAVTGFRGTMSELVTGVPLVTVFETDDGVEVIMHDLLRDALRSGLDAASTKSAATAVAHELVDRSDLAGAAHRFAEIGDDEGIELVAERLLEDLHVATVVGDRMDAVHTVRQALGDSSASLALHGVTQALIDPARSEPILVEAIAAARAEGRRDHVALCMVRLADVAYGRGNHELIDTLRSELADLADAGEPVARRHGFVLDIWSWRLTGRDAEIVGMVDDFLAIEGDDAPDDEMRAVAFFYGTICRGSLGDVRGALALVDEHAASLPPGLFADRLGGFVTIQLWMLGEQGEEVRRQAARLVDQIEARGQMHLFVEGAASTAIFYASVDEMATALALVERAERRLGVLPADAWAHHSVAQARAVVQLLSGDEEAAAATLERAIPAAGPLEGLPNHIYGLTGALSYILVPRSRAKWDDANVRGDVSARLDTARALVAFRDHGDTSLAAALPWSEPHRLRPWAFGPHLAELAVAASAGGNSIATGVLSEARRDNVGVLEQLEDHRDAAVSKAARHAITVTARRPAHTIELGLLGPLSIRRNAVEESDNPQWRRARVRDLIALLVHERSISRQRAAEVLWPDKDPKAGQNNLRSNLSSLLTALEPARQGSSPSWFIRSAGDMLRLEASEFLSLDTDRFEAHRAAALSLDASSPRTALVEHLRACNLYRGEYLLGSSLREFVYFDMLRLRGEFTASATRAADLLVSMGEADRAEALARRATGVEPLNEPLLRALVASLFAQRRFGAAREVLGNLVSELRMLQIPPEPETRLQAGRLQIAV